MRLKHIPLHITILTVFLCLLVLLSAILIGHNYYQSRKAARLAAHSMLATTRERVLERITSLYEPSFMLVESLSRLPDIATKPDISGHIYNGLFIHALRETPNIQSLNIGYADGDYYLVTSLAKRPAAKKALGAPDNASFMIQVNNKNKYGNQFVLRRFLNDSLQTVASALVLNSTYNPTVRNWYQEAQSSSDAVLSKPYLYSFSKMPGVSVSRNIDGTIRGVLAVDIALSTLCEFMQTLRVNHTGTVFIFSPSGTLLAHSDPKKLIASIDSGHQNIVQHATLHDLQDHRVESLLEFLRNERTDENQFVIHEFSSKGKQYLASVTQLQARHDKKNYLAIIVPVAAFTAPLELMSQKSIIISLLTVLAFIPLISQAAKRISYPLHQLAEEAESIRNFELERDLNVNSHITEVNNLAQAMRTMKSSLSVFVKYVPKDLVEKMVRLNIPPVLGGERRTLTILFSDIENFSTLAEQLPPEDLTLLTSEYFSTMSKVIQTHKGTIDKYIGDSIMAFWNAPAFDEEHAEHACYAALALHTASKKLNQKRQQESKPVMPTRVGIHTGSVIVGNVGSKDRMEYTAMGSAVNLASRLEGLNTHFGTSILVSERTKNLVSTELIFRPVAKVLPKGLSKPIEIFELMGAKERGIGLPNDITLSQSDLEHIELWNTAYLAYQRQEWSEAHKSLQHLHTIWPEDTVTATYLGKCKQLIDNPPDASWSPLTIFTNKHPE